jgi:hypothetical protein
MIFQRRRVIHLEIEDPLLSLELVHLKASQENIRIGECQSCFEQCVGSQKVQCQKAHKICEKCVTREVKSGLPEALGEGRTEFSCPAIGCTAILTRATVLAAIPKSLWGTLLETDVAQVLAGAQLNDIVNCSHCKTPVSSS